MPGPKLVGMAFRDQVNLKSVPFWGVHVAAVAGVAVLGWSWSGLALALALYFVRMFGITAGHHRYFSHRTYKMGRGMQLAMAIVGTTSVQKGVLWWAAHHRVHHKHSDEPKDIHSVRQRGFWWAHVGWITSGRYLAARLGQRAGDLCALSYYAGLMRRGAGFGRTHHRG